MAKPTNTQLIEAKSKVAQFNGRKHASFATGEHSAQLLAGMEISAAVAKASSDDEWMHFVETGQLPEVVPLPPRLLEFARGGIVQPMPGEDDWWERYQDWLRTPVF